jgi:hypothetical protein
MANFSARREVASCRPLDLLYSLHNKIEAWILKEAGIEFVALGQVLRVVKCPPKACLARLIVLAGLRSKCEPQNRLLKLAVFVGRERFFPCLLRQFVKGTLYGQQ